ncbi:hypothetical protein BDY21DRAFT_294020 [Lineolata rhizophorae]|uniref:Uncharacterized protein n=1 Tax=Lineolata rhizophorae TaxID=578093 RepID=A0A6A6NN70_9PEZI|nr:hypothetical protein BDY21DRAFT_294020 [Lineolata rhizophorae]
MPFRSERPIVSLELESMHTIDTRDAENLFGLWSVFSKCSETMEHGKRLENMSWRLWNRETFCCAPEHQTGTSPSSPLFASRWSPSFASSKSSCHEQTAAAPAAEVPELSSTPDSESSTEGTSVTRPTIKRTDSTESRSRGKEKHITPNGLEKIVCSIKEKKQLEPLSPLPKTLSTSQAQPFSRAEDTTPRPVSPARSEPSHKLPESSTSTVATTVTAETDSLSPTLGSGASTSTNMSEHSVVYGFQPGRISSSHRSKTQLMPAQSLQPSQATRQSIHELGPTNKGDSKKKGATFVLGCSSDEGGESSLETHMQLSTKSNLSNLSNNITRPFKKPSFKEKPDMISDFNATINDSAIESEDEEDDEQSESAIEEDDEEAWEDSDSESEESTTAEKVSFQRVDSRPALTSHRSLLTSQLHEKERAAAFQNNASRSTPAIRRSRTSSPNGPSLATSPDDDDDSPPLEMRPTASRARPIIVTTSNTHPPALSPRTTRRNMLAQEMPESLRKHILWERQQKSAASSAALKRRHTSHDVKNLRRFPGEPPALQQQQQQQQQHLPYRPTIKESNLRNNSWNAFFDQGLQEYHEKGW